MTALPLILSRRMRETPFEKRVLENGARSITIYNHMTLATRFASLEEDYDHLCKHVQIWDVSCERQVEVTGPDAERLCELVTPRDLSDMKIGQGRYAPLVDENGGIVNDPIILKLANDRFWVSLADSDVCLWMKGLATGFGMNVKVFEPDVSPLAVQGPKAEDLMAELCGDDIRDIRFFWFKEKIMADTKVIIARSGWSGQGGFEIYLQDKNKGLDLWDLIFEAGEKYNIRAGCPNQIERMETGLLSYGSDMTIDNNPVECGLDRFYTPGKKAEYIARDALDRIASEGIKQKLSYLLITAGPEHGIRNQWKVLNDKKDPVGFVTSIAYSQLHKGIIAFAYIDTEHLDQQGELFAETEEQACLPAALCNRNWERI